MRTISELAQEVLEHQSSEHLTDVLQRATNARIRLEVLLQTSDPKDDEYWADRHPIIQLWVSRINYLCGLPTLDEEVELELRDRCKDLAKP